MPTERFIRISRKNQICLPTAALKAIGSPPFIKVSLEGNRIILTPAALSALDAVQEAFSQLGLTPAVIAEAKAIARRRRLQGL